MTTKSAPGELAVQLLTLLLDGPKSTREMAAAIGSNTHRVNNGLRHTLEVGRVALVRSEDKANANTFEITDKGRDYLANPLSGHRVWPAAILNFIRDNWGSPDWTITAMGRKFGKSSTAIRNQADAMGLPSLAPANWTPENIERLRVLAAQGLSQREVGEQFGVAKATVRSAAKRFGVRFCWSKPPAIIARPVARKTTRTSPPEPVARHTLPTLHVVPATAKPWLERDFGECAFPVAGEGADTFSCCQPIHRNGYCADHVAVMFEPRTARPTPSTPSILRRRA